ncbi:MAG: C40 family peptidase, partial [Clostridia bacterium]|nr:C40 family peptidase [Clostridia bacterium]
LVFFQGTYDTAGMSHVGIYVGNGMMLHCGDPIQYANLNTNYWQAHFAAFGRLP